MCLPGEWALRWQPCLWRVIEGGEQKHWSDLEACLRMPSTLLQPMEESVSAHTGSPVNIWLWTFVAYTWRALSPCIIVPVPVSLIIFIFIFRISNCQKKNIKDKPFLHSKTGCFCVIKIVVDVVIFNWKSAYKDSTFLWTREGEYFGPMFGFAEGKSWISLMSFSSHDKKH